jgi:hypothetical protein
MIPFVIIGNPANRRVTMFQAALAAQGLPPAHLIAWTDVIATGARVLDELANAPAIVRIDAAGEDDDVERALIARGEAAARREGSAAITASELARIPREVGRILHPRQHHLGFLAVLDELSAALQAREAWRVLQPPAAIAELFDKRVTSARWRELGIPVPDVLPGGPVRDPDELRARMSAVGWHTVFVKVASASSASCLAIFTHGARELAVTTVEEVAGGARYNTRKLQRLTSRSAIDRLLRFLLAEGAQVERAMPKPQRDGRFFDLRVLAVDGEAAFVIVRSSPHEITNLSIGGTRGDLGALRASVSPPAWERMIASCVQVQRASGAFHVGVDVMLEPDLTAHRVIEGNAFGDLLPNLERDGLDVYGWQIARLQHRQA